MSAAASRELVRITVRDTAGVFAARQLGREAAAELGLERQDQVRVATALSEIGRELVVAGQVAEVAFLAADGDLVVRVVYAGPPLDAAVTAAARLMDRVEVSQTAVVMAKQRPPGQRLDVAAAHARLSGLVPVTALDALRQQNEDLIAALGQLRQQQEELLQVNAELEETNRGVMALYSQLSEELEETNRGVVALYAELDEKSERLREASAAKDRFWANVSHELRSPLNSIIGLARLLSAPDSPPLRSEQRHQVSLIESAGADLHSLVNDLLDTAKAESGRWVADPVAVDVPAMLARLRALLRPMADDRPVTLTVDAAGAPAELLTDEVALTAILRNLVSNGLKYTDRGEVRLTVRSAATYVDFVITDTGIGIPADQQERIFEEFFQVPGVRRGGTGLGLPYALRLTELLGGRLTLTSQPDHGTTATVRLPCGLPEAGVVLVADDDAAFRQVLRGLLEGTASQVIEAADGEQALASLNTGQVDLLLADLRMPGLDGYALLDRLPPGLPAIVITSLEVAEPPARASGLLNKDQLNREKLIYAIRRISGVSDA
jgi:signal transduction histidine kinase/CheY-like chemotaxis protein